MVCLAQTTMAQGLEGIIVERYYQADAADAAYTSTEGYTVPLSAGAVTYRVYVDMAAGYKFVQLFGTPTQNLVFNTTTSFYNDENYDSQTGPNVSVANTKKHTAMIDSWLTAGLAATGKVGVTKDEDNDGSIANPHTNGILGNTLGGCYGDMITGAAGKDGMLASSGTTVVSINTLGMGGSILDALTAGNSLGNITVSNGSLAALGGIVGAGASNKVLIGQFTTDGVFTFNLNVQLLNPSGQAVNYVHSNAGAGQVTNASLIRTAGAAASVSMVASISSICAGESVTFTATPTDAGTNPSYQWKVNGNNVGTNAATFTSTSLINADVVSCTMTPGCDAQSLSAVNSNSVTITVNTPTAYYMDGDNDSYGAGAATNACASPGAGYVTNNTDCNDANANAYPTATEVCGNGTDEDCSGADLVCPGAGGISSSVAVSGIGQFGFGVQSSISVNLTTGTNSVESPGIGNDRWYSFLATGNAVRIALTGASGVADDNDLGLYSAPATTGVQLVPLVTENDVTIANAATINPAPDAGSEVLYYGNCIPGQTYYVCVRNNNNTPGTCSLSISFLRGSQADIGPFTGGTGFFINTCANFKAAFRSQASGYIVKRWPDQAAANAAVAPGALGTGTTAWTFSIPPQANGTGYTICQLGRILPANLTSAPVTYYVTVDVVYNLKDAAGNNNNITAFGNVASPVGLNNETALTVRSTDLCNLTSKNITSFLATNRSVCGTSRYDWKFKEVFPTQGLSAYVAGGAGASRLVGLSSVAGIATGKRYDVWIRAAHLDGISFSTGTAVDSPLAVDSWFPTSGGCTTPTSSTCAGNASCVKTLGAAGMVANNDSDEVFSTSLSNINVYPNPSNGSAINVAWTDVDGVVKAMVLDATGRVVLEKVWLAENGLMQTLSFNEKLSSGLYNIALIHNNETQVVRFSVAK